MQSILNKSTYSVIEIETGNLGTKGILLNSMQINYMKSSWPKTELKVFSLCSETTWRYPLLLDYQLNQALEGLVKAIKLHEK